MRAAPAVSVRCTGGAVWHALQWLLPAQAAAVLSLWALQHLGAQPAYSAAVALVVGIVAWRLTPQQSTLLTWDGQQWWADTEAATVQVMIDLGPWLLLRFVSRQRRGWIAVAQHDVPAGLHALRTALYGPRPKPAAAESADV
jgi:hypothetical protein